LPNLDWLQQWLRALNLPFMNRKKAKTRIQDIALMDYNQTELANRWTHKAKLLFSSCDTNSRPSNSIHIKMKRMRRCWCWISHFIDCYREIMKFNAVQLDIIEIQLARDEFKLLCYYREMLFFHLFIILYSSLMIGDPNPVLISSPFSIHHLRVCDFFSRFLGRCLNKHAFICICSP